MFFSYFYYFVNWNFLILSFIEVVFGTLLFLCFFTVLLNFIVDYSSILIRIFIFS